MVENFPAGSVRAIIFQSTRIWINSLDKVLEAITGGKEEKQPLVEF